MPILIVAPSARADLWSAGEASAAASPKFKERLVIVMASLPMGFGARMTRARALGKHGALLAD
jgi:hypothetical protein